MKARNLIGGVFGLLVGGLVAAAAVTFWPAAAAQEPPGQTVTPELIARGQYVATAADCVACHTVEGGQPYAGGRAFRLPFGVIYSPNITPDRETGIGGWTDGQFLRAVHRGVGRNGEELYPAFPYTSYARMTDADVLAIKAYLSSLPAIRSNVRENGLNFPFNQRPLMRFWKLLFMPRGGLESEPKRSAEWNRGAYLVTALGHCGECHTPRNLLYGFKTARGLSGETMQGWTAWNITSDASHGIGAWSVDEIAAYLGSGYAPGRGVASGPMKEAVDFSLSRLTAQDRRTMAVYLKGVAPQRGGPTLEFEPPAMSRSSFVAPSLQDGQRNALGRRIFEGACAGCHAWNGQGQQTPLAALRGRRSVNDPAGLNVVQTVLRGGSATKPQGHAFMPSFGRAYSDAELAAVSNYVIEHFSGREGRVTAKKVAK